GKRQRQEHRGRSARESDHQQQREQCRGKMEELRAWKPSCENNCDAEGGCSQAHANEQQGDPGNTIGIAAYITCHCETISPRRALATPRMGGVAFPDRG